MLWRCGYSGVYAAWCHAFFFFLNTLWLLFWSDRQRITVNEKLRSEGVQPKGLQVQLNLWPCRQDVSWMCGACYLPDELQGHPMTSFHRAQNRWQRAPAERFSHCGSTVFTLHRENRRPAFPGFVLSQSDSAGLSAHLHTLFDFMTCRYTACVTFYSMFATCWIKSFQLLEMDMERIYNLLPHHIWSEWRAYVHLSGLDYYTGRFVLDPLNSGELAEKREQLQT